MGWADRTGLCLTWGGEWLIAVVYVVVSVE